ncbi:DUF3841 domain-containing protein [Thermodesulfobacteriota bacterium]
MQSTKAAVAIRKCAVYYAQWQCVCPIYKDPYQWMVREMVRRGISPGEDAPIWTWRYCGEPNRLPTLSTARSLLSDRELEDGISVIELNVPDGVGLLSSYRLWNKFVDEYLDGGAIPAREGYKNMFNVPPITHGDDIQACLPRIERLWVIDVRPLGLAPDDYEFDPNQGI